MDHFHTKTIGIYTCVIAPVVRIAPFRLHDYPQEFGTHLEHTRELHHDVVVTVQRIVFGARCTYGREESRES